MSAKVNMRPRSRPFLSQLSKNITTNFPFNKSLLEVIYQNGQLVSRYLVESEVLTCIVNIPSR